MANGGGGGWRSRQEERPPRQRIRREEAARGEGDAEGGGVKARGSGEEVGVGWMLGR